MYTPIHIHMHVYIYKYTNYKYMYIYMYMYIYIHMSMYIYHVLWGPGRSLGGRGVSSGGPWARLWGSVSCGFSHTGADPD